ncbi:MAG: protein-glutamate O-methyltransferase CheR [Pirellulales bacterium]|nr:protein-glutamate O-methyltransferase CheR [Pirellulales bacterium]
MNVMESEIPAIAQLVRELCGVALDKTKAYLIDSRLGCLVEEYGFPSFADFCRAARADQILKNKIIDAITTQETLFFRDKSPFEALQHKMIPELIDFKAGTIHSKRIRIWSAACSTGQETYSIAMVLCELLPDIASWDINILGTDISNEALTQASLGRYSDYAIERGMTATMLAKYFIKERDGYRVKDQIRSLVRFDRCNLIKPFNGIGPFDVIFCRNVAIYFDEEVKCDLFNRLADRLLPKGWLVVGSSESLTGIDPRFVPQHHCRAVIYQPNWKRVPVMV